MFETLLVLWWDSCVLCFFNANPFIVVFLNLCWWRGLNYLKYNTF